MTRVGFSPKPGISEAEADAKITVHVAVSNAHHTPTSVTEGAQVQTNVLRNSNDAQKYNNTTSYVKKKEVLLNADMPMCRVKFDLETSYDTDTAYAKIYKNGSPIGAERSKATTGFQNFTEDFTGWVSGDLIQIYLKVDVNAQARCKNMRFHYSGKPITHIIGSELTTALGTESTISVTNQDP